MKRIQRDNFIKNVRKLNEQNDKTEDKAFSSIVENLYLKNIRGKEKAMGIDEYDSEPITNVTLIPGHIYAFSYKAQKPTKYNNGIISFEFYDDAPLLLCMNYNNNLAWGINLNFCNYGLRTLILNDIYNIDPEFFEQTASDLSHRGQFPISKKISSFFMNKDNQTKFLKRIVDLYKIKNYDLIFRTYSTKNVRNIRFVETWQWQYIPFLTYKGSVKTNILNMIQHITGIDKVKI